MNNPILWFLCISLFSFSLNAQSITLIKSGTFNDENGDGFPQIGETISYSFTVENTGNVNMSNVSVSDPLVSIIGGPIPNLAPNQIDNSSFIGNYQLTSFDLNSSTFINSATVIGSDPSGNQVSNFATEETVIYISVLLVI